MGGLGCDEFFCMILYINCLMMSLVIVVLSLGSLVDEFRA